MFSKIPEISLSSAQTSSQSASLNRSQSPGKASSQQTKPGTSQQTKPGTSQKNVRKSDQPKGLLKNDDQNISKQTKLEVSALNLGYSTSKVSGTKPKTSFKDANHTSPSIVEELETSPNRGSGLDGAIIQARRYSVTSTGRSKSPELSVPQQHQRGSTAGGILRSSTNQAEDDHVGIKATSVVVDQSLRRMSIPSLPSAEQQQTRRSSANKAASAVATNERLSDQYPAHLSIASSQSAETQARRFSAASSPKSLTEVGQEDSRRLSIESYQQRRRSSRENRRRASLILVGSNYRVGRKIGAGNFGEIRLGKHMSTEEVVAIKLEPMTARFSQLRREYFFYKKLGQPPVEGIPAVYFWSTCLRYNALVMELLGPNLAELFDLCNQRFTLQTVLQIALQTIRRIQFVHSKSIVYRDVKPENFVIGRLESKQHIIYLLDFGLAKEYIDPDTHEHIPLKENKGITGTARYISINMHQGKEMSRRDDLEALGYMLMYFLKGRLPWQGQHLGTDLDTLNAVSSIKMRTPIEQLCQGYPREFSIYLQYVRGLGFFDSPDYDFLSKLFQSLLLKLKIPCDWSFDWMNHVLYVTPSGLLVTKFRDSRVDVRDDSVADHASSGEGGRFQSNKAMFSYDNLQTKDRSVNVSGNKETVYKQQNQDLSCTVACDTRIDETGLLTPTPPVHTKCIFCRCCGVCCIHKRTIGTNRISPT